MLHICRFPFAKPPVGDLRFKDPKPIDYHGDIYATNTTRVGCIGARVLCSIGQCADFVSWVFCTIEFVLDYSRCE